MSEILAPAGSKSCALAAINAGADAIYLGLDKFSARSSAENFDCGNFIEICKTARAFGVKVYAALNTVVKECELESFLNSAVWALNNGADALIVQDLFLGGELKRVCPQIKIHLSTQAGTCNALGAVLAKKFGFDRVILARETKLADIAEISKIIETEVFVQGALCTCFSGQCYMSSFAGGNSGNRGKCKQPCRKLYSIDRVGFEEKAYRLSLSDLCVGKDIEKLIDAGAASFKIEGRMRRPEYVSAAVSYYRSLLDGKSCGLSDLKRAYNRGNYTKGLAFGQDKSFISSAVQGHIGEFAGIIKVENSKYICVSKLKFSRGDGFKILRGGKEAGGGLYGGEAKGGFIINTRERFKNGDKVFVTTDTALNERLLTKKRFIPIDIKIVLNSGKPAVATLGGVEVFGDEILQKANTRAVTQEDVRKCFDKVDAFPFSPSCKVLTDGVFMPTSALNAFRRRVYSEYYDLISKPQNEQIDFQYSRSDIKTVKNPKSAVISTDLRGLQADIGILKLNDMNAVTESLTADFNGEKFLFVPPYLSGEEIESIKKLCSQFDGIYCDSYFGIELAGNLNKKFFAGTGFNITNSCSLERCKADYICLSKELTVSEADALSAANTFYLTSGNIKIMDLIYCPFEKKCSSCSKLNLYTMTDGDGREFPLRRYKTGECRFEVYNCAELESKGCAAGSLTDATLKSNNKTRTRGHTVSGIF